MNKQELLEIIKKAAVEKVEELNLSNKGITLLPPEIGQLTNLKNLLLHNNQLTSLPPEIGKITNLKDFNLIGNRLTSLPPEIGKLTNLTRLDLLGNQLTSLPPEIGLLTSLTTLSLAENQLTSLPPEISQLTSLTNLWIWSNHLASLPPEIGKLKNLTTFSLFINQLTSLPPEIGLLTNLTDLLLHNNQLTSLPPEIGLLTNLTDLLLHNNQLTSLPPEIGQITSLTKLSLDGNPDLALPQEVLKKGTKAILQYLREVKVSEDKEVSDKIEINDSVESILKNTLKQQTSTIKSDLHIKKEQEAALTGQFSVSHDEKDPPDALGYEKYAEAFADIITDEYTQTPLTIGICAPWGMGKTVLLNYIEEKINSKNDNKSKNYQCIHFDAWKYSKSEQIWAEFYSTILNKIESNLSLKEKLKFKKYFFFKVYPFLENLFNNLQKNLFNYFDILLIIIILMITLKINIFEILGYLFGSITIAMIPILWRFCNSLSKYIFKISKKKVFKNVLGFQYEIFKHIDIVCKWFTEVSSKRIIIFIDDLDRCPPPHIMQVLESIKLFLDIKNFVFFLALDSKVVRCAIGKHYDFIPKESFNQEEMGRSYLEKIIQIPFHLPKLNKEQLIELNSLSLKDYLKHESKIFKKTIALKITPKASFQISSDLLKGKNEDTINNTDQQPIDSTKDKHDPIDNRARLEPQEKRYFKDMIEIKDFNMSPRLLKRFINIYMIARHILITENNQKKEPIENFIPDISFFNWIAISVIYPFESKALLEWWSISEWQDPYDNEGVLTTSGIFKSDYKIFKNLNMDSFSKLYNSLGLDYLEVRKTRHITDCFNFVLD